MYLPQAIISRFNNISILLLVGILLFTSCRKEVDEVITEDGFVLMSKEETGIDFQNQLVEGPNTNIFMYEYFYNGGGVAVADFNNDGLEDIYFTSNMQDNALYLNMGNMKFKDITAISGASGRPGPWKTGVTAVDINSDGLLDIHLSYSGMLPMEKRVNQLFVNQGINENGNPLFKDMAAEYGLDNPAYSNQAYFFDYDRDDDLDMLLLNHNPRNLPILNETATAELLSKDDKEMGLRLFQQSNGKFRDVTLKSGINGSALSYGLGLGISDLDQDGWPDFYVSNDYTVPDYLYINNKNGTFSNQLKESLSYTSQFSMGNDIADYNNDGLADIFTLDMLPEDNKRQKLLMGADNHTKFDQNVRNGFYFQYMRNMMHLNNGDGSYSEIGQLAGVSNTDWSWSALLADFDNDGWKDIFVSNGYVRDYTNMDFIKYLENYTKENGKLKRDNVLQLLQKMPASNVSNYIFKNNKDLTFLNKTKDWGMHKPSNSNGSAYADFDNDGDLDLVVNNINQTAYIYKNNTAKKNYLQIELIGKAGNRLALGTKIKIYTNGAIQYFEQQIARGYLSSVSPNVHVGLGNVTSIDSITIVWPDQYYAVLKNIEVNKQLIVEYDKTINKKLPTIHLGKAFFEKSVQLHAPDLKNLFRDFDRQLLLTKEYSHEGACIAAGDINNDGLEDLYVGGSLNVKPSFYLQDKNGKFRYKKNQIIESDFQYHDSEAAIVDVNGDGNKDLIVASGGYHDLSADDVRLEDRLYLNNGNETWTKTILPKGLKSSKSCISTGDLNGDGKIDIFIGGRLVPGNYPEQPSSSLLINNGNGTFTNQDLSLGMITDAQIVDLNSDKSYELVILGEWVPISIFKYENGKLIDQTNQFLPEKYSGFWNTVAIEDYNGDGKKDILACNLGLNSQLKTRRKEPIDMVYGDFDKNNSIDFILSSFIQAKKFPYLTKDELGSKLPGLNKKYSSFESYSEVGSSELLSEKLFNDSKKLEATHLESMLFLSGKDKILSPRRLPIQVQFSPIYSITNADINKDGHQDVLLLGNEGHYKIRLGKNESNYGTCLLNDGKGNFSFVPFSKSGLELKGDYRQAVWLNSQFVIRKTSGEVNVFKLYK